MERDRGVGREVIIRAIESALKTATARHLDCNENDIRVAIDRKSLVVKTFRKLVVSADDTGPTLISLAKARRIKPDAVSGDEIEIPIAAESIGIFKRIFLVSCVLRSAVFGRTVE